MPVTATLTSEEMARYSRQIILPELGVEGQQRLKDARVLVIGAGGLGSPVALYLAAAGVGTIGLTDFDRVELHNLQRQVLHDTEDVGRPKTASGRERLTAINPHVRVELHEDGVRPENAVALFELYDLVVDGTDNFPTRYLNTDAAFFARRPLVYGSIFKFEGQVTLFEPHAGGPCYRCLFPEPPPPGSVPNCGEAGVLGALCGIVGSLQAMEAIKRLAGISEGSLQGRLLVADALAMRFRTLNLRRDPACPLCGAHPTIRTIEPARYAGGCAPNGVEALPEAAAVNGHENGVLPIEVDVQEAAALARSGGALLLDVREPFELAICRIEGAEHIPMREIPRRLASLPRDRRVLALCHHGGRSHYVAEFLRARGFPNVSNVRGGVDAWAREVEPTLQRY